MTPRRQKAARSGEGVANEDIDAMLDRATRPHGAACQLARVSGIPRQIYERGIATGRGASLIARAMTQAGYSVTHSTILRHLSGDCATCRKT